MGAWHNRFFIYSVISYLKLKSNISQAVLADNNVYQSEILQTPFVFGFLNPSICLPAGLSEKDTEFILLHETIHMKRFGHLIKPAAYIILILHWYIGNGPKIPIGFSENSTKERIVNMMKNKKTTFGICILAAAVICILFAVLLFSPGKSYTAQINVPILKVREAPSQSAEVIGLVAEGDTITIIEDAGNGFVKIEFEDSTAYIMSKYLTNN